MTIRQAVITNKAILAPPNIQITCPLSLPLRILSLFGPILFGQIGRKYGEATER